jgi:hypothetical protein
MGWWEAFETEQAAIAARIARFPAARDAVLAELPLAWPPRPLDPPRDGWMELGDSEPVFRETARGKTWEELPALLVKREYALMGCMSWSDLAQVLPAWLRSALVDTASNVEACLVFAFDAEHDLSGTVALYDVLAPAQRTAVRHFLEALALRSAGRRYDEELQELVDTVWSETPSFPFPMKTREQRDAEREYKRTWWEGRNALLAALPIAFPPRPLTAGSDELRDDARARTWLEFGHLFAYHRDEIAELSAAVFVEFLPAWLAEVLRHERQPLAPLLARLREPLPLSAAQRAAVLETLEVLSRCWAGTWRERELKTTFKLLGVRYAHGDG